MDSLLKDAIADAKTVRETALENAKLALTEAFTPTLQSMLSQKLREEDDEMDMDMDDKEEDEEAEEAPAMDAEAGDEDHMPGHDADEGHGEDHDEEEGEEEEEGMREEEGDDEDERMAEEEGDDEDEDDDLDLEAIIRELEEEAGEDEDERDDMKEEEDADEDKEEMDEQSDSSGIGKSDNKVDQASGDDYEKAETEKSSKAPGAENADDKKVDDLKDHIELDLDSIIREIEGLDEEEDNDEGEEMKENEELEEVKKSLEEHREVIVHLREKINEVNLLNAKLLYTNKLFRNHNLNDGQKLKVVETFDRATNIREVKLVFTTLAESFDGVRVTTKKRSVNESVASKAVASTKPKQEIVEESNDVADRFKQLAGLIK
jgi:hypothetical protein